MKIDLPRADGSRLPYTLGEPPAYPPSAAPAASPVTHCYKTGVVLLAWPAGHQAHFRMGGGLENARSVPRLVRLFELALPDLVAGCVASGVTGVGLWREPVAEYGLARTVKLVREAGVTVTSLCRGGFFQLPDAIAENRRAIEEAAELGAPVLVLVSGGLPEGSPDLDGARQRVADALAELAPYAGRYGVRLAIEALHPMYCSDRCVVSTLDQALDLAMRLPAAQVGVMVDTYHLWWDPGAYAAIARAGAEDRIALFQVADWITPLPEGVLTGRGMLGDGCVELRRFHTAVDETGYTGPIEVEIFNDELWAMPGAEALSLCLDRFAQHVT